MPPTGPQPPEGDRLRVADWIDETLRATACDLGEYAGPVVARRLNRTEYQNTVRDLFGLRIDVAESFPVDGSGGERFDNNGETLFFSPLLLGRYLEVAEHVLAQVVVTPPLGRAFVARTCSRIDSLTSTTRKRRAKATPSVAKCRSTRMATTR